MSTKRIVTEVEVKADPSEVYRMFTNSTALLALMANFLPAGAGGIPWT